MKTYIFDKSGIGVALCKESDVKIALTRRVWKVYESGNSLETCRFSENGVFESDVEGEDSRGSWTFSPYDARLVVSCMGQFLNYNLVKLNDSVLILNENGTDRCAFLVDEQNEELLSAGSLDEFIVLANKLCDVQHSDDSKVVDNQSAYVENGHIEKEWNFGQDNYAPSAEIYDNVEMESTETKNVEYNGYFDEDGGEEKYDEESDECEDSSEAIEDEDEREVEPEEDMESVGDEEDEEYENEESEDDDDEEEDEEDEDEYDEGDEDVDEDDDSHFEETLKNAKRGDVKAMLYVALCYKIGKNVRKDEDKAYEFFLKAAELGNDGAMIEVAREELDRSHSSDDEAKAVKWFRKSADMGNSIAMYELGQCYEFGVGVDISKIDAKRLYVASANAGYAVAQYYLGTCFNKGNLFDMNGNQAYIWFEKAAKQGHLDAIVCVADICRNTRNYKDAFYWYKEGAKKYSIYCMVEVARIYRYGYLGKTDIDSALSWYQKAFDSGFDSAKIEMKEMLDSPVASKNALPKEEKQEQGKTKVPTKAIIAISIIAYMIFSRLHILPLFFLILIFGGVAYIIKKNSKKENKK